MMQYEFEAYIMAETERAVFVSQDEDEATATWLPRSMITMEPPNAESGDIVTITMPLDFAKKKRLVR